MKNRLSVRGVWALVALVCAAVLAFGLYVQHVQGITPCSLCVLQRYAWALVGLTALGGALMASRLHRVRVFAGLQGLWAFLGFIVALRQSWLQWFPPEFPSCGRDWNELIENFPLSHVLPLVFQGHGDCARVDWSFLGASMANWSAMGFLVLMLISLICGIGIRPKRSVESVNQATTASSID
jgi:disulfide bond formation protein DsbB